ncbi:MAG: hypothetical protein MHMPM18_000743 [Marteilia pararefringens]
MFRSIESLPRKYCSILSKSLQSTSSNYIQCSRTKRGNTVVGIESNRTESTASLTGHHQSTLGFTLRTGPSYEEKPGLSYLIAKAAFQIFDSTGPRHKQIIQGLRDSTIVFDSQLNRDSMFYAFSWQNKNNSAVDSLLSTFLELIHKPIDSKELFDEVLLKAKEEMQFLRLNQLNKDPGFLLHNHLLYPTAFQKVSKCLSMPMVYEDEHLDGINYEDLVKHQNLYHTLDSGNLNIISIGFDHMSVEKILQKFQDSQSEKDVSEKEFDRTEFYDAQSGICLYEADLSATESNMNALPEQAHIALAFPLPFHPTRNGISEANLNNYATQMVFQTLFGGGSSFSSGGPGKGLHSKLYSDGLGRYHWLSHLSCHLTPSTSFNNGFLIIHSSAEPQHLQRLFTFLSAQLLPMLHRPMLGPRELLRSKNQLKLNISLRLEHVPELMEQVATSLLHYGKWFDLDEMFKAIDQVSVGDLKDFAKILVKSQASFLAMGKLKGNLGDVQKFFDNQKKLVES